MLTRHSLKALQLRLACIALCVLCLVSPLRASPEEHIAAGRAHLHAGRALEARIEFTAAQDEYHRQNDAHGEAVVLLLLGIADVSLDNIDVARGELQEGAKRLDTLQDYLGAWTALLTLGELEKGMGLYTAALAWHDQARQILEKAKAPDAPLTIETFIVIASRSGLPSELGAFISSQKQMMAFMKPMVLQSLAEPLFHDAHAGVLLEAGQLDRAEEELTAVMDAPPFFSALYESNVATHRGDLYYRRQNFAEARTQYEKALQGVVPGPMSLGNQRPEMRILARLADLEISTGHLDAALAWNDKALDLTREAGNRKREAALIEDRGHVLMRGDRYAEAETAFNEALRLATEIDDVSLQASIEANLGGLHMVRGNYGTSIAHFETAVALYQTLNDSFSEALVWANLAELYILTASDRNANEMLKRARMLADRSQYDLSCHLVEMIDSWQRFQSGAATPDELNTAFEIFAQQPEAESVGFSQDVKRLLQDVARVGNGGIPIAGGPAPGATTEALPVLSAMAYLLEGRRQLAQGNVTAAREVWRKGLETNPNRDLRVGLQGLIGATYWKDGNAEQAVHWMSDAAKTLEVVMGDLRGDALLASYLGSERHAYYDVLLAVLLRSGRIEQAFDVSERARARAFLRLLGNRRVSPPAGGHSALTQEAEELRLRIANWEQEPLVGETLAAARERYQSLYERVQASDPEYASLTNIEPLKLDVLRRELPSNTTLISYFVSAFGVDASVIDKERLEHVALPLDEAKLRRISCWTEQLGNGRPRGARPVECGTDPATAEEAYAQLIAPLRSMIRTRRLLIVPHGPLHYVPFAALRDPATKRYLIEDYTILYAPSASSLRFLRAKETPVDGGILVMGDPAADGQAALPGAKQEAEKVAQSFHTTAKLGVAARKDLLYHLGGKVDLVHIAAHGYYESTAPLFSFIALADSDGKKGKLEVDEILYSLDLRGVNLVVLSACRSGVGKRSGGDEIVGLTRSILYAGSPGVIATLWNIDDAATARLMEKFYARLLDGALVAEALRSAQLDLLHEPAYADPAYWGAFFLTGDPLGRWKSPSPQ